jgi:hypothetical protein
VPKARVQGSPLDREGAQLRRLIGTGAAIGARPWYLPQHFIPLGGMIIGDSMNAVSIGRDRLFSDLRTQRAEIELAFCLGATYQEATRDHLRDATKAGMIPSLNALMTVRLVWRPGMMTGQILAGQPPLPAVRYQIVVMLMLVASTALGSVIVLHLVRRMWDVLHPCSPDAALAARRPCRATTVHAVACERRGDARRRLIDTAYWCHARASSANASRKR